MCFSFFGWYNEIQKQKKRDIVELLPTMAGFVGTHHLKRMVVVKLPHAVLVIDSCCFFSDPLNEPKYVQNPLLNHGYGSLWVALI
jgi:hypothetical protein